MNTDGKVKHFLEDWQQIHFYLMLERHKEKLALSFREVWGDILNAPAWDRLMAENKILGWYRWADEPCPLFGHQDQTLRDEITITFA